MRTSYLRTASLALALAGAVGLAATAFAQVGSPAAAGLPRTADGHPDFTGAWAMRPATVRPPDPRGICVGFNCGPTAPPAGPAVLHESWSFAPWTCRPFTPVTANRR